MKIIRTPKYTNYYGRCDACNTIFKYQIDDISDINADVCKVVCPCCGRLVVHNVNMTSMDKLYGRGEKKNSDEKQ